MYGILYKYIYLAHLSFSANLLSSAVHFVVLLSVNFSHRYFFLRITMPICIQHKAKSLTKNLFCQTTAAIIEKMSKPFLGEWNFSVLQ